MQTKKNLRKRPIQQSLKNNKKIYKDSVYYFLQMLNTIKIYHWKTTDYSTHKATDELYSEQIVILKREFPSLSEKSYYYFQSSLYFIGSPNVVGKLIKNLPDMLDINLSFDPHNDFSNKLIELNLIPNASCPFEAGNFTRPIKIV